MESLDKTREFQRGAIQELLGKGIFLMDTAYEIATNFRTDAESLLAIYNRIPEEAKYPELKESIEGLKAITGSDQLEEFLKMKQSLTLGLNKLLNDLPFYDSKLSEKIEEAVAMTQNCTQMVESIRALIPLGMNGEYDALAMELRKCKEDVEKLGGDLLQNIKNLEKALKGIDFISSVFSKDPVNLSTGNFIYDREDISLKGRYPLSFKRFYNAVNERSGSLGADWNHNYEIYIQESKQENRITVILEDGREDIYQKSGGGAYIPFWFCGSSLEKTKEGYQYTTQDQTRYFFDQEGRHTRQEDLNGNGITLSYEEITLAEEAVEPVNAAKEPSQEYRFPFRISKVKEDTGNTLAFTYNQQGLLETVTDQTGRNISLTYEDEHLHTVTGLLGRTYTYTYGKNGKLQNITNPRNTTIVTNQYDRRGRTVTQTFLDGGRIEYEYLDKERTVILTEQNGNKIHYLHDEQNRHTGTLYTDESGNPVSKDTDKAVSSEIFEYNSKNRKTNCTDRNGNRTRFKYDSRGNIIEVIDPLRQRTGFTYNAQNRLTQVRQADGSFYRYEYDAAGNPTKSTNPLGHRQEIRYQEGLPVAIHMPDESVNHISYDRKGNLTAITDANGNRTRYEYDALNRVVKTINPNGHSTCFAYNLKGEIIQATNEDGNSQTYEYDAAGKVKKVTGYDGGITTYRYNAMGKPEEITDPAGNSTRLAYDLMWNLKRVTDPLGSQIDYEYDHYNRLVKTTDPEGQITRYEHDGNGNVTAIIAPTGARTEIAYDALNRRQEIRDGDGAVTRFSYDVLGNLTGYTDPGQGETKIIRNSLGQIEAVTDPMGNTTAYTYTPLGQPETITDAMGGKTVYGYGPVGQLHRIVRPDGEREDYDYDPNGNITKVTDGLSNTTILTYDCMDRVKTITDPLGHRKEFAYDPNGNITAITDEKDHTTTYTYSPTGEVIQVTDALGHSTRYDYDKAGRLTRMEQYRLYDETYADIKAAAEKSDAVNGKKIDSEVQVTAWEYNRRGEVTRTISPLGGISSYRYDGAGSLISQIDEEGLETLYEYNQANKLTKVLYADGKTVELSYGPLRQLSKMKDWLGTTTIETDALGRATKVTDYEGKSIEYQWDALSRRKQMTYPDGSKAEYCYTPSGRLEEVMAKTGSVHYRYDPMGRIKERTMPEGIVTNYTTDPLGRLTGLTHEKDGELLDQFRYTYDPVGNITRIDKYRKGAESDSGLFSYGYDPLGRLTEATGPKGSRQYHYDSLGNRTRSLTEYQETTYRYNARNQLLRSQCCDAQRGETITEYGYDPRGNLTRVLENGMIKKSYGYDATNRMTEAATAEGNRAEYIYNGFLKRVKRLEEMGSPQGGIRLDTTRSIPEPTREIRYLLDLTRPYHDLLTTEGQENRQFIWGNELLMAEGETAFCYLSDHLGSPIRLMRGSEEKVLAYDEFGVPTVEAGAGTALHNPFGFTGYQNDEVSGLYYAQARNYAPEVGRFFAEDPMRDRLNWYVYCCSNPIRFVDPSGNVGITSLMPQGWVQEAVTDVTENIINVISPVIDNIKDDINNFDLSNTSEDIVLSSHYISAYKGQVVIKAKVDRPGSFGRIMVLAEYLYKDINKERGTETIQHEGGHYNQFKKLGILKYIYGIFLPSALNGDAEKYYSQLWEVTADIWGGVTGTGKGDEHEHWPDSEIAGEQYFQMIMSVSISKFFSGVISEMIKGLIGVDIRDIFSKDV